MANAQPADVPNVRLRPNMITSVRPGPRAAADRQYVRIPYEYNYGYGYNNLRLRANTKCFSS